MKKEINLSLFLLIFHHKLNEIVTDSLEQVEASRGTEDEQNQKWLEKLKCKN